MTIRARAALCVAVTLTVSACAQAPKDIHASYVSESKYAHWNCESLKREYWQMAPRLEADIQSQQHRRNWDIVTAAVIGITPTLLNPDSERATEIAMLKGETQAIQAEALATSCVLDPSAAERGPVISKIEPKKTYPLNR